MIYKHKLKKKGSYIELKLKYILKRIFSAESLTNIDFSKLNWFKVMMIKLGKNLRSFLIQYDLIALYLWLPPPPVPQHIINELHRIARMKVST
jgi:hypothetical protein